MAEHPNGGQSRWQLDGSVLIGRNGRGQRLLVVELKRGRASDVVVGQILRYVGYVQPLDAALHADYRFFHDDWGIDAHTLKLSWYQPLPALHW